MSPFLQQSVSFGSLDGRVVKHTGTSLSSKRRFDAVCRGWKTKSFKAAAEKISNAAKRLEGEAEQESSFWDQVAHVKDLGWAVSRLPRDSHAIAVHFGFAESAPRFRNRGFAVLRRDHDGKLLMDRAANISNKAGIQVVIFRDGKEVTRSSAHQRLSSEELKFDDQILQARDALFEEELFYEMSREGRSIANQGVFVSANTVKFDIDDHCQLQIELVESYENRTSASECDRVLADYVAWALRILLTYAHAQNLLRRSKSPPPLSLQPKVTPEYALLRPLISHLRHQSTLSSLRSLFLKINAPLKAAGLHLSTNLESALTAKIDLSQSNPNDLLQLLLEPAESTLNLTLPTKRKLDLTVRTYVGPPTYGTEYGFSHLAYDFAALKVSPMNSLTDVKTFIFHCMTIDILSLIESIPIRGSPDTDHNKSVISQMSWRVTNPHAGELVLEASGQINLMVSVRTQQGKLGVRIQDFRLAKGLKETRLIWDGDKFLRSPADNRDETRHEHLIEILKSLVAGQESKSSLDSVRSKSVAQAMARKS